MTGHDVLYLGFSSALSGTYNAGLQAAKELAEIYPDKKILTVDTLAPSLGEDFWCNLCVQQRRAGLSIEEVRDYAEGIQMNICHWLPLTTFNHLKCGGRISGFTQ